MRISELYKADVKKRVFVEVGTDEKELRKMGLQYAWFGIPKALKGKRKTVEWMNLIEWMDLLEEMDLIEGRI